MFRHSRNAFQVRGQLWPHRSIYIYCFLTQKQAGGKCLHTVLHSTESVWLSFSSCDCLSYFFSFEVNTVGRVFDLAAFIRQNVALSTTLWREADDGGFNRSRHTKKPDTEEIFEDSGVRGQAREPHKRANKKVVVKQRAMINQQTKSRSFFRGTIKYCRR